MKFVNEIGHFQIHMSIVGEPEQVNNLICNESYERLTQELIPALWRTAFRLTGCKEVADDLTQDACVKAFKSFDQYEKGSNYKAWLFKILTNLWRDQLRKESRAPFKLRDEQAVDRAKATHRCEPEFQCQNREFYTDALKAMSRLSPQVRLVVSFSLLDGLSYQEIADIAGIPIGTVRSRLNRGRRQLQEELREHYFENAETTNFNYLVTEKTPSKRSIKAKNAVDQE